MSKPTSPTYKTTNWTAYNEALKRRGSLTIWFDPEMGLAKLFGPTDLATGWNLKIPA
jgi:hypothetical protein